MDRNIRIYISGRITKGDFKENLKHFNNAQQRLQAAGYDVINPAKIGEVLPTLRHDEYMRVDEEYLRICDVIYMLDGYAESEGATEELNMAHNLGKTILYETAGQEAVFNTVSD